MLVSVRRPPHENIDAGREIDWNNTSADYAEYRRGPPESFYRRLEAMGIGIPGQLMSALLRLAECALFAGLAPRLRPRLSRSLLTVAMSGGPADIQAARCTPPGRTLPAEPFAKGHATPRSARPLATQFLE